MEVVTSAVKRTPGKTDNGERSVVEAVCGAWLWCVCVCATLKCSISTLVVEMFAVDKETV